jgi:Mrp family chromosome partitioning ATPase
VGAIPSNPAELLDSMRLKELLDKYQSVYNYILVDAPPIDVVADAQIISRNVTSTLFVVLEGLLERELLTDLEIVYQQKRLPNMSLVLNGVKSQGGRYGYGYYYGSGIYYSS